MSEPPFPDVAAGADVQLRDYAQMLIRHRWLVAAIVAAGLGAAALYNWIATPQYVATATLRFEADPNVLGLERPLLDSRDWMQEFLPTELGVLESRDLAQMAHDRLTTDASSSAVPAVDEILLGRSVASIRDTRLVTISFTAPDPEHAQRVANALAQAYVQRTIDSRASASGDASAWLSRQVAEQRVLVEQSEAALQRYREEHGADALFRTDPLSREQQNIVVQKLSELQAAATRARAETIDKEAQYRELEAVQAGHQPLDTLPSIAANPYIQGLKGELTALQRQLAQASRELGDRHPEILKLTGAVEAAQRKLQTEIDGLGESIRHDYEAAQARERAFASALATQRNAVQTLNAKSGEYTALEREAASNREALDKLFQRAREVRLAQGVRTTNVSVLDSATVPLRPAYPRKIRTLLLAGAGSTVLALGLVLLLDAFNTRVRTPGDIENYLRIPLLGITPQVPSGPGGDQLLLDARESPRFAEMLRTIRTNLILSPAMTRGRTLVVTSAQPGEGKTLTAANLAASLARLNQRVLLIDADLRRPRLHEMFGLSEEPGLTDVLSGRLPADHAGPAIRETRFGSLWLMPAGANSRNPADLLGGPRFATLIEALQAQFDWVILDSPPVLAVTDACVIAGAVSGVLFVVGRDQTARDEASAALDLLDHAGGRLVGAVLNRVTLDRPGESYLPYYHRRYDAYTPGRDGVRQPQLPAATPDADGTATASASEPH